MLTIPHSVRRILRGLRLTPVFWRFFGLVVVKSLNWWMASLSYRAARYDPSADPADESFRGPVIYVFWHEYIPLPIYLRPHSPLAMLVSQHQDAEVLSHVARFAGLEVVRGSTNRGGTGALRELIARGKGVSLAITPDGPRGPRRRLAQGCIYLSSRLQIPIVCIGFGYDRPWRNRRSWDQFAVPRPFSRCRAVLGPRMQVPPGIERETIEHYRQWVEQQLQLLTSLAEDWAERRFSLPSGEPLYRSPPRRSR